MPIGAPHPSTLELEAQFRQDQLLAEAAAARLAREARAAARPALAPSDPPPAVSLSTIVAAARLVWAQRPRLRARPPETARAR
jgi:hypothetical protein